MLNKPTDFPFSPVDESLKLLCALCSLSPLWELQAESHLLFIIIYLEEQHRGHSDPELYVVPVQVCKTLQGNET